MKKILYMMGVPWKWIKQRPHFIAEGLSKQFAIRLIAEKNAHGKLVEDQKFPENIQFVSYPTIKSIGGKFVSILNYWFRKLCVLKEAVGADIIWITYPVQWSQVKEAITSHHLVVYDCMDDIPSMYSGTSMQQTLIDLERKICERANLIIVSSDALKQTLKKRYDISKQIHVVNNAISKQYKLLSNMDLYVQNSRFSEDNTFYIVYIGTISSWFDFDVIKYCLDKDSTLQLVLFGPLETEIPVHPRIVYGGVLAHEQVFSTMNFADLLVMPFQLTDLVLNVNPVKAYEYIYSGKPVALVRYAETEKFEHYVNLYSNGNELSEIINQIKINGNFTLRTNEECEAYAFSNTWDNRCDVIFGLMNEVKEKMKKNK